MRLTKPVFDGWKKKMKGTTHVTKLLPVKVNGVVINYVTYEGILKKLPRNMTVSVHAVNNKVDGKVLIVEYKNYCTNGTLTLYELRQFESLKGIPHIKIK